MMKQVRSAVLVFLSAGLAGPMPAQTEPKDRDPEVEQKLEALQEAVGDRGMERDQEAVRLIEELLVKYRAPMHRRDQRDVERTIAAVFDIGPLRDPERLGLYEAAAKALGEMGRVGAQVLQRTFESARRFPKKPEWVPLRATLLDNIGATKEEWAVKFLIEEATRNHERALMAAAGGALGSFQGSKQQVRKEIVNKLLIRWGEFDARWREGNTDPHDIGSQTAGEYLAAIKDKWNTTLGQLTGQQIGKFLDWQQWWNDNKGKSWDRANG